MIHEALKAQGIDGVVWRGNYPTTVNEITTEYLDGNAGSKPRMNKPGLTSAAIDIPALKSAYRSLLTEQAKKAQNNKQITDDNDIIALLDMTAAEVDAYLDKNITNISSVRSLLKKLTKLVILRQ